MGYKLLTCETAIGPRVGVLIGERVYSAEKLSGNPAYQSMLGILQDWDAADAIFSRESESGPPGDSKALADVRILPPILYPGEIWAAGANYQDHISEIGDTEYRAVNAKFGCTSAASATTPVQLPSDARTEARAAYAACSIVVFRGVSAAATVAAVVSWASARVK